MMHLKCHRKEGEVQSSLLGDMILRSGVGISTGTLEEWGFDCRNTLDRFLESLSAVFDMPGIWEVVIFISKINILRRTKGIERGT